MALPIKETPILYGKDAVEFHKRYIEANEGKRSVSKEDYLRAKKVYDEMMEKQPEAMQWL